ncbi:hypothetical protein [Neobacillus cucumis]|nr:hypothetical protein [Neobacillus cucumis]
MRGVRKTTVFGQGSKQSSERCPNEEWIRTGLIEKSVRAVRMRRGFGQG